MQLDQSPKSHCFTRFNHQDVNRAITVISLNISTNLDWSDATSRGLVYGTHQHRRLTSATPGRPERADDAQRDEFASCGPSRSPRGGASSPSQRGHGRREIEGQGSYIFHFRVKLMRPPLSSAENVVKNVFFANWFATSLKLHCQIFIKPRKVTSYFALLSYFHPCTSNKGIRWPSRNRIPSLSVFTLK